MTSNRAAVRRALALTAVVLVMGVVAVAAPAANTADAAPVQQQTCAWQNLGNATGQNMYVASAMDTDLNKMYLFGGANTDYEAQNSAEVADFSGGTLGVTHGSVSFSGAQKAIGAAGAYRAKGDTNDSAVYFIGGLNDKDSAAASGEVYRYFTKTRTGERMTGIGGTFAARAFAAAAYDPVHDVIWVTGGIGSCELGKVLPWSSGGTAQPVEDCNAKQIATAYLKFDATGATWNVLSGQTVQIFGHTMVYDPDGKRMILFGGTKDIRGGEDTLQALDLSDADPANAKLVSLADSGTSPKVAFHGAAYDAKNKWMVVTGGVKTNHMKTNESAETGTYALDLTKTPATWTRLVAYRDRIGGAMEFVPKHQVVVFTLGRNKATDPLSPKIDRKTDALVCQAGPTATTPVPTTPTGPTTVTPGTKVPTTPPVTVPPAPEECDFLVAKVPGQARADAMTNPGSVYGYQMLCNPNLKPSPYNTIRNRLSMQNPAKPYHPLYNALVWSCGCP